MYRSTPLLAVAMAALLLSAGSPLIAQSARVDPSADPSTPAAQTAAPTGAASPAGGLEGSQAISRGVLTPAQHMALAQHKARLKRARAAALAAKAHLLQGEGIADDPESRPVMDYRSGQKAAGAQDPGNLVMSVIGKLALVVALIFACAAGWKRWQGGMPQVGAPASAGVRVTSTVSLGPQRYLHVVTVGRRQLLLASSPQNVSLLTILDSAGDPIGMVEPSAHTASWETPGPAGNAGESGAQPAVAADRFEELLLRLRQLEMGSEGAESYDGSSSRHGRSPNAGTASGWATGDVKESRAGSPRPAAEGGAPVASPAPGSLFRTAPSGARRGPDA